MPWWAWFLTGGIACVAVNHLVVILALRRIRL